MAVTSDAIDQDNGSVQAIQELQDELSKVIKGICYKTSFHETDFLLSPQASSYWISHDFQVEGTQGS